MEDRLDQTSLLLTPLSRSGSRYDMEDRAGDESSGLQGFVLTVYWGNGK